MEQSGIFRPVPPTKVRNKVAPTWMMKSFFCKKTNSFSLREVVEILEIPPEKCVTESPQRPSTGEAYVYKANSAGKEGY